MSTFTAMSIPAYTLTYFNVKGLAETTRVLFAVSGVEYTDNRLPIDTTTFARPEFNEAREAGAYAINMDRVPLLMYQSTDGSVTIGQSKTIERFVAQKTGLYGKDIYESAQIDMICEHIRDIYQKYNDAKAGKKDAELIQAKDTFIKTDLPKWLQKLEVVLASTAGSFAVGNSISLADVAIQQLIQDYFDDKEGAASAAASCPKISASCAAVAEAAKGWFATRPVTKF